LIYRGHRKKRGNEGATQRLSLAVRAWKLTEREERRTIIFSARKGTHCNCKHQRPRRKKEEKRDGLEKTSWESAFQGKTKKGFLKD